MIRDFIKQNITGSGSASNYTNRNVKEDLDKLQGQVDELKQPVQVSLQSSYDDLSKQDKFIVGAAGGAVVGGSLGLLHGLAANTSPTMTINPSLETHTISRPEVAYDTLRQEVAGTTRMATADGLKDVSVPNGAIRYNFPTHLTQKEIGHYETPTKLEGTVSAGKAAAIGGLEGLAVGALTGLGITLTRELLRRGQPAPTHPATPSDTKKDIKVMVASSAIGAALGAGVGALDGHLEQSRIAGLSADYSWKEPVMEHNVKIGTAPQSAFIYIRRDLHYPQDSSVGAKVYDAKGFDIDSHVKHGPTVEVNGDSPKLSLFGKPVMTDHSETVHAAARYSVAASVAEGAILGGLLGLGASVASNVIKKIVEV